jgi:uncharacterized protein (TIGR02246 family)
MVARLINANSIFTLIIAGFLLFFVTPAMSQRSLPKAKTSEPDNPEKITAIIRDWEKAWNNHDMKAFAHLFQEDGVWILWTGEVWKGRTVIEEGLAAVHKTVYRNSVQKEEIEEITFIGPDAAVVRFHSTLTGDERYPEKVIQSRKLLIITRRKGDWKIGWGQNTRFADKIPN